MMRYALALLAIALLGLGIYQLREETLSEHEDAPPDSEMHLVLEASSNGGEDGQTLAEMTEAVLLLCRLEVEADAGPLREIAAGRFEVTLHPALDDSDQVQFRGCMEDWVLDHFLINVVSMEGPDF